MEEIISIEDQRSFIKICYYKKDSISTVRNELRKALGQHAVSYETIRQWYKRFDNGRININREKGQGRQRLSKSDEIIQTITELLEVSSCISVRDIAINVGVDKIIVHEILTELKLTKKYGKWVPHNLTEQQKMNRKEVCRNNLELFRSDPGILIRIMAIDESYIKLRSGPSKKRAKFWLPQGKKAPNVLKSEPYAPKVMIILGVDVTGHCIFQLLQVGSNVDSDVYRDFLSKNVGNWARERSIEDVIIFHDNCSVHKSTRIRDFIESKNWSTLQHPTYSPDIHPCDFNIFGNLKESLSDNEYNDIDELQQAIEEKIIFFQTRGSFNGVKKLPERWISVINSEGDY